MSQCVGRRCYGYRLETMEDWCQQLYWSWQVLTLILREKVGSPFEPCELTIDSISLIISFLESGCYGGQVYIYY